jgi:hypothetical protein
MMRALAARVKRLLRLAGRGDAIIRVQSRSLTSEAA